MYISMSTAETHTTDHEPIQTCPNILKGINAEANHTHQYKTVDTPIEMNQNPVYNIEADYENNDLGPTRNEQLLWGVICVKMTMTMYTRVHSYAHYNMHVNMHMHVTICMSTCICTYNKHVNIHMHVTICMHATCI